MGTYFDDCDCLLARVNGLGAIQDWIFVLGVPGSDCDPCDLRGVVAIAAAQLVEERFNPK
ncbi:MAG: hypothetical protein F6K19_33430 [Cyanothece sp. SIO1E1]|nr:hypothetical protein [Cyanothece sp. SIO1E1]